MQLFKSKKKVTTIPFPNKKEQKKKEETAKKSVQDLIPIKEIENGFLITPDNKMVMVLKVSALNLELASNAECNEIFEIFEGFLMSLTYPVQITNVSMPVNLKVYISEQESIHKKTQNDYKKMLLESYIDYSKEIELSQDIMQRQRYIVFSEQMNEDTPEKRSLTMLEMYEKKDEIVASISELDLEAEQVNDLELIRYLHAMFDYSGAQTRPIESPIVPQIIMGGNK